MSLRAVFLDAGDTLFTEQRSRDELYTDGLRRFGIAAPPERVSAWRQEEHDAMPEVHAGHRRYTEGWFGAYMLRILERASAEGHPIEGIDPEAVRADLAETFTRPETYAVYPDVFDALEDLTERGVRLAVVSNWSERLTGILDGLGLSRYFEQVVISAVVGATKPDRALFLHATAALGVDPSGVLHVGDHPVNDVAGARRAGLSALLLDRGAPAEPGPGVIRDLTGILPWIDPT